MLQFINRTPFVGMITLFPDPDGIDTAFAVVKGTFTLGQNPTVAEEQVPIVVSPEYHGEPADSSVKRPTDVSLSKPGTDIVILGHAFAPNGYPVSIMEVVAAVGPVYQTARVFGDRVWESNGASYSISAPRPFVSMPLVWERSFGGRDQTESGPCEEPRNPVGVGFRAKGGTEAIDGTPLPNVEDPMALITSWKQTPAPVGFAPVAPHWEPRRQYAGTYDEAWQESRAPFLPDDFDVRFLQMAPASLIAPGHLRGGEPGTLDGFAPEGRLAFRLPSVQMRIEFQVDGQSHERPIELDTVVLEPAERRCSLVWRAAMPCDKKSLRVSEVVATLVSVS